MLKKKLFVLFIVLFLSINVKADQCDVSNLNTVDDVAEFQKCVKEKQVDFEKLLMKHKIVQNEIISSLEYLISQEANCIVTEKLKKRGSRAITQAMIDDCQEFSKTYAIKWSQAGSNFQKLIEKRNLTEEHIESLRLKFNYLDIYVKTMRHK